MLLVALLSVSLLMASELNSTLARRDRERALLQVGHEFRLALQRYQTGRGGVAGGQYPAQLEDLLRDPRYPGTVRHWRRLYVDPVSGGTEWGLVRQGGRIVGLHSLSTLQPIKQDGFDPDDEAFRNARSYRDWVFTYPVAGAAARPGAAGSAPLATPSPAPAASGAAQPSGPAR
ncbi:MAG: type II secretion system protein [Hylemonella sp.]|nr:type II secretion system protein [Hylemonella sp.]